MSSPPQGRVPAMIILRHLIVIGQLHADVDPHPVDPCAAARRWASMLQACGDVSQMCEVLGGYEWGYVAARWVWSNAAAKSRVRGWKLCHAACLQAVSRASFARPRPLWPRSARPAGEAGWPERRHLQRRDAWW